MTMFGASWGLRLRDVTPVAKLVAIRLGDGCNVDGSGQTDLSDLEEFCCAARDEIAQALELLALREDVAWHLEGDQLTYGLPRDARPPERGSARLHDMPASIYVIRGRLGLKIGITQSLSQRLAGLRAATLDDTVTLIWSADHTISVIRKVERFAHQRLAEKLIRNEWFDITTEDAIAAIQAGFQEIAQA